MELIDKRKAEIAAMTRNELNAHAFLCEQEQEEYERELRAAQEEIAKLKEEIKRLSTCPECGGSEINEFSHDPYYALPCVCTVDWMAETMKVAQERYALLEGLKSIAKAPTYGDTKLLVDKARSIIAKIEST